MDSTHRTVIIENIPDEAAEENVLDKFKQVGNVIKFTIVRDGDFLRNKVVGYCEYSHREMALNAVKILNGVVFLGKKLKVGMQSQNVEIGNSIDAAIIEVKTDRSNESGEAISQAVASLPPDQMYELMKQMKLCIQNNPNEARNMLLQNPQLAYALLQAQIVMKIADPKVALAMLNRSSDQIPQMVCDPSSIKAPQVFQPQSRNVSVYHNIGPSHNTLATSSTFDNRSQEIDPGIASLTKFFTFKNSMSLMEAENLSDVLHSSLPPRQGKNFNAIQPQVENSAINIVDSIDDKDEREKAALILQVLKLTDQQIAMLPEDQRRSILVLKDQLRKS